MSADSSPQSSLRVVVQQPALPKYRIPFFAALASRFDIDLRVEYAEWPGVPNAEPRGFEAVFVPQRILRILGQQLVWHGAQWRNATKRRADVLVVSWNARYLSLLPTLIRARLGGVPVVAWGHGVSKAESETRWAIRAGLARLARCVLFYSESGARQYIDRGFPRDRVFVAQNAIDQAPIRAAAAAVRADPDGHRRFLVERGLDTGPVILFVSRLEPENQVDLLIDAVARLGPDRPGLRLVVVGAGPDEQRLRERAHERGVADRVQFAGPIYDERTIAHYYLAATAFTYPNNIGLSLLHAFGYGVPVVTGDDRSRHNPEIDAFHPGENGLFFRSDDTASLADTLARVIDDPALRARLSDGAYRTASEVFTLDAMVDGFLGAILHAAGRPPAAPSDYARTRRSPISAA